MDSFSFLMVQAKLEYYEDMALRMQKEAKIREMKNRQRAVKKALTEPETRIESRTCITPEACADCAQAPILRAPLEQDNERKAG